jgi:hypothetical protein
MFSRKNHLQSRRMKIVGQPPNAIAENIKGFARHDAWILIDQCVQGSIEKQFARAVRYFVANEDHQPLAATLLQRLSDPGVAGPTL